MIKALRFVHRKRHRAKTAITSLKTASSGKFAEWFHGSRVMNTEGDPSKVFHGTCNIFRSFRSLSHFSTAYAADVGVWRSRKRHGHTSLFPNEFENYRHYDYADHVTDQISAGHHYPVYLRICCPLQIYDDGEDHGVMELAEAARKAAALNRRDIYAIENAAKWSTRSSERELIFRLFSSGIDGYQYKLSKEDIGKDAWIILSPHQARSIFAPDIAMHRQITDQEALNLPVI